MVLRKGFGMADQQTGRLNTAATVFGLGSIPIDFTRAAILRLMDDGVLDLSDKIGVFFPGVPAEKSSMTLRHLMTHQSGLPNFHHHPELDDDFDLTWIDRNEAVQRILNQPLLFAPGSEKLPSHSAFVLLAAVVEVVSGQSYANYLTNTFFEPIGMRKTGFYGDKTRFEEKEMAVGYGASQVGEKNMPIYWGPTSWLIMGSGGMVSTVDDLYAWIKAMYSGKYLSAEAMDVFGRKGRAGGISDRGFLVNFARSADTTLIYMTNAHSQEGDLSMAIGAALMEMAN